MIDQAYVEFGGTDLSQLVRERENTVVVRTLSKAFADRRAPGSATSWRRPAGGRARGDPAARQHLLALGRAGRDGAGRAATRCCASVAETVAERERMREALLRLGWSIPESRTNFLFCDLGEPNADTVRALLGAGIVVRTFDALPNHLRITLGRPGRQRPRAGGARGRGGQAALRPAAAGRSAPGASGAPARRRSSCAVRLDGSRARPGSRPASASSTTC